MDAEPAAYIVGGYSLDYYGPTEAPIGIAEIEDLENEAGWVNDTRLGEKIPEASERLTKS